VSVWAGTVEPVEPSGGEVGP